VARVLSNTVCPSASTISTSAACVGVGAKLGLALIIQPKPYSHFRLNGTCQAVAVLSYVLGSSYAKWASASRSTISALGATSG